MESETLSLATASSSDSGCTYFQEMKRSFSRPQPAQAPFAQEAVEGNIDVDDDHAALGFQQVDVVDHLGAAAVHVEDRLAHQVLVQQHPAGLIDEGGIAVAALGRLDEDGVGVDLHHALPGNQFGRVAPAVLDIDARGLGIRLLEAKDQVGELAEAVADLARADLAARATPRNSRKLKSFPDAAGIEALGGHFPADMAMGHPPAFSLQTNWETTQKPRKSWTSR